MANHSGKMFGFIVGSVLGGPIGAGVGTFLGTMIDEDQDNNNSTTNNEHLYGVWVKAENGRIIIECPTCQTCAGTDASGSDWHCNSCETPFTCVISEDDIATAQQCSPRNHPFAIKCALFVAGSLAKADGRVSEEEIDQVTNMINLYSEGFEHQREEFQEAFRLGRDSTVGEYKSYAVTFRNIFSDDSESLLHFVSDLICLAFADGEYSAEEKEIVEDIAINIIGVKVDFYNKLVEHFTQKLGTDENELCAAYLVLGCPEDSSFKEIKSQYRILVQKYHPDTIASKDLPEEFIEFANQKFVEVQKAFELIEAYHQGKAAA